MLIIIKQPNNMRTEIPSEIADEQSLQYIL